MGGLKLINLLEALEQKFLITFPVFPDDFMPPMDYSKFFTSIATVILQTIIEIEISFDAIFKDESLHSSYPDGFIGITTGTSDLSNVPTKYVQQFSRALCRSPRISEFG